MYHLASRIQDNIKKYKLISPRSILPMNYKLRLAKPVGPHFPDGPGRSSHEEDRILIE